MTTAALDVSQGRHVLAGNLRDGTLRFGEGHQVDAGLVEGDGPTQPQLFVTNLHNDRPQATFVFDVAKGTSTSSIALEAGGGSMLLGGHHQRTLELGDTIEGSNADGERRMYAARFDESGVVWAVGTGGNGDQHVASALPRRGAPVLVGSFTETLSYRHAERDSRGGADIVVLELP